MRTQHGSHTRGEHACSHCHITFKIYLRSPRAQSATCRCKNNVRTHLILGYFLCCCIVTAPRDGESDWERKTKGKRKERAEVVAIWDKLGCSFHMLEMASCLYDSQKQELCHTTLCTLSCCREMATSPALPLSSLTVHHHITGDSHTDICTDMSRY